MVAESMACRFKNIDFDSLTLRLCRFFFFPYLLGFSYSHPHSDSHPHPHPHPYSHPYSHPHPHSCNSVISSQFSHFFAIASQLNPSPHSINKFREPLRPLSNPLKFLSLATILAIVSNNPGYCSALPHIPHYK